MVRQSTEIIATVRDRILSAQSRQKSYADTRRRPLEFEVGDLVMLKVSPMKGVRRFGKRGKLAPRYIGPFRVLARIGAVSYRLQLPAELAGVHDVFHVSMLRRHFRDEEREQIVDLSDLDLQPDLTTVEMPVRVLDREVKVLRHKQIPLLKVLWSRRGVEETSWEREEDMRRDYPQLFGDEVLLYLHLSFCFVYLIC
jgi:hypothetical protein